jgi:hypothetical protein
MKGTETLVRCILPAMLCAASALGAQTQSATLIVRKIVVPANDPGKFDLQIDNVSRATAIGNNGVTGPVVVAVGTHTVGEIASGGTGTNLANYTSVFGGACGPTGRVTLARGDNKTCTITNTKKRLVRPESLGIAPGLASQLQRLAQLEVVKHLVPADDPGRFLLGIDGRGGTNVGNNGTTGAVDVSPGMHTVGELGAPGTNAVDYTATYSANCANGKITVQAGTSETCIITNTKTHGSWTQGPGTYNVSVCSTGSCDIHVTPGQSVSIKFEAWGGGGGGGGGFQDFNAGTVWSTLGGPGGGGGGGGGYDIRTLPATAGTTFSVQVGSAGPGGTPGAPCAQAAGGDGGESHVMQPGGTYVVRATGGAHGLYGGNCPGSTGSLGGAGGRGSFAGSTGAAGTAGAITPGCAGGGGGTGGVGGGPGSINNGGGGGHGGWMHHALTCTAHALNYQLTSGTGGKNGKVLITW